MSRSKEKTAVAFSVVWLRRIRGRGTSNDYVYIDIAVIVICHRTQLNPIIRCFVAYVSYPE
jgi:hypothetical protein